MYLFASLHSISHYYNFNSILFLLSQFSPPPLSLLYLQAWTQSCIAVVHCPPPLSILKFLISLSYYFLAPSLPPIPFSLCGNISTDMKCLLSVSQFEVVAAAALSLLTTRCSPNNGFSATHFLTGNCLGAELPFQSHSHFHTVQHDPCPQRQTWTLFTMTKMKFFGVFVCWSWWKWCVFCNLRRLHRSKKNI